MEEKKTAENNGWRNRARPAIYSLAGVYLAGLAYSMFKQISVTSGSEQMLTITFTILFAVLGLGLILFGLMAGYKNSKKMRSTYEMKGVDTKNSGDETQ